MSVYEEIKEYLMSQLYELEALQSVYPKELIIADHGVLADINNFIKHPSEEIPKRLEYSIEISVNDGIIELSVSLPTNYPKERSEIYARSSLFNRTQQLSLNKTLNEIVERQEQGEPYIYELISWIQDNGEDYMVASEGKALSDAKKKKEDNKPIPFARYWIYSHHIYSKIKRRSIITLAKENSLTGFCLAGKPGVICIEGAHEDCEYCWQKIKAMNWQKIFVRLIEREEECNDINNIRKFFDFQEISFPSSERHNDMKHVLNYLAEHESQHIFKELFGLKGKTTEMPD